MEKQMRLTTLCYLEQDGKYLMLYRNKKKNGQSEGKYLGIGGKLEPDESPEECAMREVKEETGLTPLDLKFRGIVTFVSDCFENELMFLYSATKLRGTLRTDCPEGDLFWVEKERVLSLPAWEGDRYFLIPLLNGSEDLFAWFGEFSGAECWTDLVVKALNSANYKDYPILWFYNAAGTGDNMSPNHQQQYQTLVQQCPGLTDGVNASYTPITGVFHEYKAWGTGLYNFLLVLFADHK